MTTISSEQDAMGASPALPAARMSRMSKIGLVVLAITVAIPITMVMPCL